MPAAVARPRAAEPPASSGDKARLQVAVTEAVAALDAGKPEAALAAVGARADLARADADASYVFGLIHMNAGAPEPALAWFETALALRPDDPQALAGRGVVLHRLGRPHEALACYEAVLAVTPDDPEAAFMAGALLQNLGRGADALARYDRALRLRPAYVEAHVNRGALLQRAGRLAEALDAFEAAGRARPDDATIAFNRGAVLQRLGRPADALATYEEAGRGGLDPELACNRGNVLQKLGRPDDALAAYDEALRLRPAYPQAQYNRAIALQALGRLDAAVAAYQAALALDSAYAEARCNLGNALHALGRSTEALDAYDTALAIKPGLVQARVSRATVLLAMGDRDAALAECDLALHQQPENATALCLKGAVLHLQGRFAEALVALDAALAMVPHYPEALLNRGNALQELDRLDEALAAYELALACRPDYAEALSGRGVALKKRGDIEAARVAFDAALRLKPDFADARNNRAGVHLLSGRYGEGFADYESRWLRTHAPRRLLQADFPTWQGEPLGGRPLVIFDEQGAGDLIQFARFLPLAAAAANAAVTFICRRSMRRLLAPAFPAIRFVERLAPGEDFAAQAALMSLPHILGTRVDTIPAATPYLGADPERVAAWADVIGTNGFKIGICCHGNMAIDPHRAIPLGHLAVLAALPGVRLISLMKDPPLGLTQQAFTIETLGGFDAGPDAFVDSAAVIANLDLVVSCDTAIAHLAGALGTPAFVALKQTPDWRWLIGRADCPWYPSLRLFRQPEAHAWAPVLAEITAAVVDLIGDRRRPAPLAIPAAVGELIDKITILEIKATAISDPLKRANVREELALLRGLRDERGFAGAALAAAERELKRVNATLWAVEDELRAHEAREDFGPRFVALARQVYMTNDRRAALKRDINLMFNSAIVEEKSYTSYASPA